MTFAYKIEHTANPGLPLTGKSVTLYETPTQALEAYLVLAAKGETGLVLYCLANDNRSWLPMLKRG